MAFPHINVKTKNIALTPELSDLLEKRLGTLERFLPESDAIVFEAELSKTTEHHQAGKIFRAELNLQLGGQLLRAEATEETIENAIDRAKNELKRELQKLTGKNESLFRRGARRAKDLFRFGN